MRMRFSIEDERAFSARRDELGDRFARWLNAQNVPGDPNDAGLLMDWKFGYADGALGTWTVADVGEFLVGWCPRKLSADPDGCAEIPISVAAFVEFLAHTGLLARGSDLPSQVRRYCERNTARFVREMGNPANFGMAKSLFALPPAQNTAASAAPSGLATLVRTVEGLPPEAASALLDELTADDADGDPPVIGPIRLPEDGDRLRRSAPPGYRGSYGCSPSTAPRPGGR